MNNLDIDDAISLCYNLKKRSGFEMYECLREAKEYAISQGRFFISFNLIF